MNGSGEGKGIERKQQQKKELQNLRILRVFSRLFVDFGVFCCWSVFQQQTT
jgi:hypothetical protein